MKWKVGLQGPRKMKDEWRLTAEYISRGCEIDDGWTIHGGGGLI